MSRQLIRKAFEAELQTLTPEWPIRWENEKFEIPKTANWHRADLLIAETRQAGMGSDAGEIWEGIFQVGIFTPAQDGTLAAEQRAEALRGDRAKGITGLFYRGRTLSEAGLELTILQPVDGQVFDDPHHWGFPVKVPFISYVF